MQGLSETRCVLTPRWAEKARTDEPEEIDRVENCEDQQEPLAKSYVLPSVGLMEDLPARQINPWPNSNTAGQPEKDDSQHAESADLVV